MHFAYANEANKTDFQENKRIIIDPAICKQYLAAKVFFVSQPVRGRPRTTNAVCFRSRTKERSITNVSSTGSGCLGAPPRQTLTKIGNGKTVFRVSVVCLLVTVLRGDQCRLKTG